MKDRSDRATSAGYHALVDLHDRSGRMGDLDKRIVPEYRRSSMAAAMREVADAPETEVPMSARLGAMFDLARAGVTRDEADEKGYRTLAASVAKPRGLDVDQLMADVQRAAREGVPLRETASGQALPYYEVAFIGEDVCTTTTVNVEGLTATWIYSEFETDAPFHEVSGWVDPRNWPERGPLMFKRMEVVGDGQPVAISGLSDDHWHGVFHEEVQLVRSLNTLLHCDYWRDGEQAAGMTYRLDLSLDAEINVDQGFLSVTDSGSTRRVRALKVVGFTEDVWDEVALHVCPFWTDWMRSAVRGGTTSTPHPPPATGPSRPSPLTANLQAWVDFFGDSARSYLDLFEDVTTRMGSGRYSPSDWLADGTRYWSKLAKDWAQAWTNGVDSMNEMAREGLDAGLSPPGAEREELRGAATAMARAPAASTQLEGTVVPVAGLAEGDHLVCSDLVSIEAGGAKIGADTIIVTLEDLGGGNRGARLRTTDAAAPAGLYIGRLESPDGRKSLGVQLYVSRVREAG